MAITIKLKSGLQPKQEQWLAKNIGPRMHYIHNSIGGQGWVAKQQWDPGVSSRHWTLTLEDERYASFFLIMFPQ
jgi:hypothetical protein